MNDLSLKGKLITLSPLDVQYFENIYKWILNNDIEFLGNVKIKQKSDVYKILSDTKFHIQLLMKSSNTGTVIGYICSYNFSKLDGYTYIKTFIESNEQEPETIEAYNMFINYLYTCFPIRKIYVEICSQNSKSLQEFKKLGFKLEATLKNDTFFNGKYFDKNILALYKKDFYKQGDLK